MIVSVSSCFLLMDSKLGFRVGYLGRNRFNSGLILISPQYSSSHFIAVFYHNFKNLISTNDLGTWRSGKDQLKESLISHYGDIIQPYATQISIPDIVCVQQRLLHEWEI